MGFLTGPDLGEQVAAERFEKKLHPLRDTIAINHGSTSRISHRIPTAGLSRHIHDTERSTAASATTARPTNMKINGPLNSTPPAIAVQKTAGNSQGLRSSRNRPCPLI